MMQIVADENLDGKRAPKRTWRSCYCNCADLHRAHADPAFCLGEGGQTTSQPVHTGKTCDPHGYRIKRIVEKATALYE
jgi:hypothetical protein